MAETNELTFTPYVIRGANNTDKLQFKVWGGILRIEVVGDKDFRPIFYRPLDYHKIVMVSDMIDKIIESSPDTKLPLVVSAYNKDIKKYETDWVLTFLKDPSNLYHINIKAKNSNYDFTMKGPSGIAYGSNPLSDADRSGTSIKALKYFLSKIVPLQLVISNKKRDFSAPGTAGKPNDDNATASDENYF